MLLLAFTSFLLISQPGVGIRPPSHGGLIAQELIHHDTDKTPALGYATAEQTRDIRNVIEQELSAIGLGNISFAYENYTSFAFKKQTPLDTFTKFLDQYQELWSQAHFEYQKIPIHEDRVAVVKGSLSSSFDITYFMTHEEGEWKILGIEVSPGD